MENSKESNKNVPIRNFSDDVFEVNKSKEGYTRNTNGMTTDNTVVSKDGTEKATGNLLQIDKKSISKIVLLSVVSVFIGILIGRLSKPNCCCSISLAPNRSS